MFTSDDDVGECADALAHGLVALARLQELLQGHEAVAVQVHLLKREREEVAWCRILNISFTQPLPYAFSALPGNEISQGLSIAAKVKSQQ